jgi:hypothetical protein
MADKKISQLSAATTPLAGTEVLPIVQGGSTVKVSVDNLTKGKTVNATTFDTDVAAAGVTLTGVTLSADGTDANIDINITPKGSGEVNLSKVDIDAGAIDGTAIGANSASTGAFTTATTSGNVGVGTATLDARLNVDNANASTPLMQFNGSQVREFVRYGTQTSDNTIRVDITFAGQGSSWVGHVVEIILAAADGTSSTRTSGFIRYAVNSLDSGTGLAGPTNLASDLTGVTATTAVSGNELRVTFTSTGNIDSYCAYVRVVSSRTVPATTVVIS